MAQASYDEKSSLLDPTRSRVINSDLPESTPTEYKKTSLFWRLVYMVLLIICGAGMTLAIKAQDETLINCHPNSTAGASHELNSIYAVADPGTGLICEHFHQPFIQLFQMGVGQVATGLTFPFFRHVAGPGEMPMGDPSFMEFAPKAGLASLFDALAEVFIILGISFTNASTAEMMKATLVVFVGVVSTRFFPGFTLSWKQWLATFFMLCGASVVIASGYINQTTETNALEEVGGALLCLGAQMFYAMQFIVEEKLMDDCKVKNLHVNKGLLVFCEGWVSILCAIILQIPWTGIFDENGFAGFQEDLHIYFDLPALWATGIGLSLAVSGFDLFGLLTAEHMGSDLRAVVCACFQVVLVWTISASVGWEDVTSCVEIPNPDPTADPGYECEVLIKFIIALLGFFVILFSGLMYAFTAKPKEGPHGGHHAKGLTEVA